MFSHNHKSRLGTAAGTSVSLFVSAAALAVQLHMRLEVGLRDGPVCPQLAPGSQCASAVDAQARWPYPRPEWPAVLGEAEAKSRSDCIFPQGFGVCAQRRHDGFKPAVALHLSLRCGRGVGEKLRANEPGSLAVREQV